MENDKNITFFTYLKQFLSSPILLWGIVIVQFILIFLFLFHSPKKENLKKIPNKTHEASKNLRRINVIFNDNTYEKAIRELLLRLNGTIVDGPSNQGGYIIEFELLPDKLDETVKLIEESDIIKFASPG